MSLLQLGLFLFMVYFLFITVKWTWWLQKMQQGFPTVDWSRYNLSSVIYNSKTQNVWSRKPALSTTLHSSIVFVFLSSPLAMRTASSLQTFPDFFGNGRSRPLSVGGASECGPTLPLEWLELHGVECPNMLLTGCYINWLTLPGCSAKSGVKHTHTQRFDLLFPLFPSYHPAANTIEQILAQWEFGSTGYYFSMLLSFKRGSKEDNNSM